MSATLANLRFAGLSPLWLVVAVVALAMVAGAYAAVWRRTGRRLALWLMALRIAAILALLAAIVKPFWTSTTRQTRRPVVAVIVDTSQSMSLPHQQTSRYDRVCRWLSESPAGRSLDRRFDVATMGIEGDVIRHDRLPAEPAAERTDLVLALRATAAHLRGRPVASALILSDGQDNVGRESLLTLRDLPFDVHAIGFAPPPASDDDPVDLALAIIDAPARARLHNTTPIHAAVRKDGGPSTTATVTLERGGAVLASQTVALPAGVIERPVQLDFTPDEPGDVVLAARLSCDRREPNVRNNTSLFRIRVDAQPIRVLYIEGVLRNEYTFLAERLGNDPDVDLISFVRTAADDGGSAASVADELVSEERLKQIDVVLLGDFEATMLSDATYQRLRAWVDGGGSLMVLGGYRNLGVGGLFATPLAVLMPVEPADGVEQIEQPFAFEPSEEGLRHPAMSLTGRPRDDAAAWSGEPMLRGITATGLARPGATVLARHPRQPHLAVLAAQPFGKGVVALIAADSTWRWSRLARLSGQPDTHYARFWSQMIRWLAGRDEESTATGMTLTTSDVIYRRGDAVTVTARIDPAAVPGGDRTPELLARTPDGRTLALHPTQSESDPNVWTATFQPDRGGRYEVHATLGNADGNTTTRITRATEFEVEGSDLELANPWPDPSRLRQIASIAGGGYADIDDDAAIARLLDTIPDTPRVTWRTRTTHLWHSPVVFVLFVVALSLEWFVRRRHQLI